MVLGVLAGFSDRTPYPSGKRSDENLFFISIRLGGNTGGRAKVLEIRYSHIGYEQTRQTTEALSQALE